MLRLLGLTGLVGAFLLALSTDNADGAAKKSGKKKDPQAIFKKLDKNGDGYLSKEEFSVAVEHAQKKVSKKAGEEKAAKVAEKMNQAFDKLNTDNKGLTLEQFTQLRRELHHAKAGARKNKNKTQT